jgi:hypothetical protein
MIKGQFPKWHQKFSFKKTNEKDDIVYLRFYNSNITSDSFLGITAFSLTAVRNSSDPVEK